MWNEPTKEELAALPKLYATENIPPLKKIVHMHFFLGSYDFYAVEFDGEDIFYGFTCLGDEEIAEWGYTSFQEIKELKVREVFEVDLDLYWKPVNAEQIPLIFNWGLRLGIINEKHKHDPLPVFVTHPECAECKRQGIKTKANDYVVAWSLEESGQSYIGFLCRSHIEALQTQWKYAKKIEISKSGRQTDAESIMEPVLLRNNPSPIET